MCTILFLRDYSILLFPLRYKSASNSEETAIKNFYLLLITFFLIQITSIAQESWYWQNPLPQGNDLNDVWVFNDSTAIAVGSKGTIIKTTNGGVTYIEEHKIVTNPSNFALGQNYPNPFNPSTTINYSIPQTSNVVIKIFDSIGKELETLINEEKRAGTYELTWYAENLPSGVYFYQLRAGNFIEIKKMVLVK